MAAGADLPLDDILASFESTYGAANPELLKIWQSQQEP